MQTPTFYALLLIEENGTRSFAGAYANPTVAKKRGLDSHKRFEVVPTFL